MSTESPTNGTPSKPADDTFHSLINQPKVTSSEEISRDEQNASQVDDPRIEKSPDSFRDQTIEIGEREALPASNQAIPAELQKLDDVDLKLIDLDSPIELLSPETATERPARLDLDSPIELSPSELSPIELSPNNLSTPEIATEGLAQLDGDAAEIQIENVKHDEQPDQQALILESVTTAPVAAPVEQAIVNPVGHEVSHQSPRTANANQLDSGQMSDAVRESSLESVQQAPLTMDLSADANPGGNQGGHQQGDLTNLAGQINQVEQVELSNGSIATVLVEPSTQIVSQTLVQSAPSTAIEALTNQLSTKIGDSTATGHGISQQVAEGVVRDVTMTGQSGAKKITMHLHPAELGRLTVEVGWERETVTASIVASEKTTSELLNRDRQWLVDNLAESGFDLSSFDVSYDGSGLESDFNELSDHESDSGSSKKSSSTPELNGSNIEASQVIDGKGSVVNIVA